MRGSIARAVLVLGTLGCQTAQPVAATRPALTARDAQADAEAERARRNSVTIDRAPRCGPAAEEKLDATWLATPEMQRSVAALDQALEPFSKSYVDVTMDDATQRALVMFDKDFNDYELVRQRLLGKVAPLKVVLQPSCDSRKQLANAETKRARRNAHAQARASRSAK